MDKKFKMFPIIMLLLVTGVFSMVIAIISGISSYRAKGSADVVTKQFEVANFDEIRFDGVSDVEIIQGDKELLVATGTKDLVNATSATVLNKLLVVKQEDYPKVHFFSFDDTHVSYTLYVKDLKTIENRGVGDINAKQLTSKQLTIISKGVGSTTISNIVSDEVSVTLEGVGEIVGNGTTSKLTVEVNGTGTFDGFKLLAESCEATVRGVGSAEVNCSKDLNATILGMGSIEYKGKPQVTKTIKGLGAVDQN